MWVRWLCLLLFVAVLAFVFVNMGEWQLRRLDERKHRNAVTVANEGKPVRPFDQVFNHPITTEDEWQRVEARGTFDPAQQFVIRYRNNGDAKGYEVVTPLRTDAGPVVLVDRGFIEVPRGTQIPSTAPPPPTGPVSVVGHVRRDEHGRGGAIRPSDGQARLINAVALGQALGYPVADGYLSAITVTPAQQGGFAPIVLPELSDGPHFWYAVQWFMFTGIGVLGLVVFIRGDIRTRREEAAAQADRPPEMAGSAGP
nr:SURF1 family protein [Microlunatus panaciterrae]